MFPRLVQPARSLRSSSLQISCRQKSDDTILGSISEAATKFGKAVGWGYDASGRTLAPGRPQLPFIYKDPEQRPENWKPTPASETLAPSPGDSAEMKAKKTEAIETVQDTRSKTGLETGKGTIPNR